MSVRVSKKLNEMGKRWIHTRGTAEEEEMLEMCAQVYNYSGVICSSNCRSDMWGRRRRSSSEVGYNELD